MFEYEELPYVDDPVEALKPTSPLIHEDRNKYKNAPKLPEGMSRAQPSVSRRCGKTATSKPDFQKAARVFEHTFRTPLSHHGYIEPCACTVQVHDDGQRRSVAVKQRSLGFARPDGRRLRRAEGKNQNSHRPRRRRFRRQGVSDRRADRLLSCRRRRSGR